VCPTEAPRRHMKAHTMLHNEATSVPAIRRGRSLEVAFGWMHVKNPSGACLQYAVPTMSKRRVAITQGVSQRLGMGAS
jgi:hypothetical protein